MQSSKMDIGTVGLLLINCTKFLQLNLEPRFKITHIRHRKQQLDYEFKNEVSGTQI